MAGSGAPSGRGLPGGPEFLLPSLQHMHESTAQRLVQASPLQGLEPGMPGVSSRSWQELAAVATQLPDISWLGRQVFMWCGKPEEDLWNDFAVLHEDERTDLENPEHRDRFGEKALRYGGIDIVLRTLALFRADERVGYHGVVSLFTEALQGRTRSLLHYGARTEFFLQRDNFARYVEPRLGCGAQEQSDEESRQLTPQQIVNTMLVFTIPPQTPRKLCAFRFVVQRLGAYLAASSSDMAFCLYGTASGWQELFCNGDARSAARVLWYLCEDEDSPVFPPQGRGSREFAEILLQAQDIDLVRELDDFELELEGADAQDPMGSEEYSFTELVSRCVARRAFDNSGLQLLCEAVGLSFAPLPEGPEEELQKQATEEEARAIAALGLTCVNLAEDHRATKRCRSDSW